MLASKVYESYVLQWALGQVKLKNNQYGGMKGSSACHLLVSLWQDILIDLEDCRAATLLTAIDYAKAFNRMRFQECLLSFARHGASDEVIQLVSTFLSDRYMSVRVGNSWSEARPVHGGVPQGSILGVLLFNITTDNLEDQEDATGYRQSAGQDQQSSDDHITSESDEEMPATPGVIHSTPAEAEAECFEPGITPMRRAPDFVFLPSARNVRRALATRMDVALLRDVTLPPEPSPVTSAIWRHRPTSVKKYIDDSISDTKINMETVEQDHLNCRDKHAVDAQNIFRRTIRNAESIGMKANCDKTTLLCISDAISFTANAHIFSSKDRRLESGNELKLLGFHFNRRPNCSAQVESIKRSVRGRYWLLIHMKQHHFSEEELVKAYTTIIRPIMEYCSPAFHSLLTDAQDETLERLQATSLRYIYGYGPSYARMREMSGLQSLRARRIAACDKFVASCLTQDRYAGWFPENKPARKSRHTLLYKEEYARCDRLKNSPIFFFRRRLNGKPGKEYGQRYRHYRDSN